MSNFKVTKLAVTNPMLKSKGTNFLSEINAFFKNNDASKAMNSMMDMISGLNMSERTLFDRSTRFNSKYSLLQILTSLILFPCFMIRNPYNFPQTRLGSMIGCGKDVFAVTKKLQKSLAGRKKSSNLAVVNIFYIG